MQRLLSALILLALLILPAAGRADSTPAPPDASLYIGWPNDGEVVKSPFKVWFGLRNMGVAPAGVDKPNTGHHHLLIDVELPPGRHTLQLLMGDKDHLPFDPPVVSKTIAITVR